MKMEKAPWDHPRVFHSRMRRWWSGLEEEPKSLQLVRHESRLSNVYNADDVVVRRTFAFHPQSIKHRWQIHAKRSSVSPDCRLSENLRRHRLSLGRKKILQGDRLEEND
jgi:hypothetical protein